MSHGFKGLVKWLSLAIFMHPHTPINTRPVTHYQGRKKIEDLEIRCPQPTKGYQHFHPSQSSHPANSSTPRATDHTSSIGKGLQNQNCTFMTFKYTFHIVIPQICPTLLLPIWLTHFCIFLTLGHLTHHASLINKLA